MLDESKSDLHTAATPALDEITSYAELEALRQSAAQKLEDVYEAAQRELTNLLASARNLRNRMDGETVTQHEQKDGVYRSVRRQSLPGSQRASTTTPFRPPPRRS